MQSTNSTAVLSANLKAIDAVIVVGRKEDGTSTLLAIGSGNDNALASLFAPVAPQSIESKKSVVVEEPKPESKPQSNGLCSEKCKDGSPCKGKATSTGKCMAHNKKGSKPQPESMPQATESKSEERKPQGKRGGKGGKRGGSKSKILYWLPESECLATGTYTCKSKDGDGTFEKDVAVVDVVSSGRNGDEWVIAFLTSEPRDVKDSKGNPTGKKERHAYLFDDGIEIRVTKENRGKFTLKKVLDKKALGL